MFKNRHFEVKLVKDSAQNVTVDEQAKPVVDIEELSHHAKELGKKLLVGTLIIMTAGAALSTASQIAVNACDKPRKNED